MSPPLAVFSTTERQCRAAAERLARQSPADTPEERALDRREKTAMRDTLPGGTMPQVATGPLSQAVLAFALQSANQQLRETQEAEQRSTAWQSADEQCVKTEEFRHLGKMTVLKNKFLHDSNRAWGQLKSVTNSVNEKTKGVMASLIDGANAVMRTTAGAGRDAMKLTMRFEPLRVLVSALGVLANASRQQREESNNLREQTENLGGQPAGGTASGR